METILAYIIATVFSIALVYALLKGVKERGESLRQSKLDQIRQNRTLEVLDRISRLYDNEQLNRDYYAKFTH